MLRFRDYAGFLQKTATPPLFDPNFVGVPFGLDRLGDVGAPRSEDPMLIIRVIIFEVTQGPQRYRVELDTFSDWTDLDRGRAFAW